MEEQKNIKEYIYNAIKSTFTIILKSGNTVKYIGKEAYKMAKYYLLKD